LKIYGDRIRFYFGLVLVFAAAWITPTQFLWAVFGYSIVIYLPVSLTMLMMSFFIGSFRNPERYKTVLGIRTGILCAVFGAWGVLMVAYYPFAQGFSASRAGMLMCFAALEIFLLRREAAIRCAALLMQDDAPHARS
jgi:hypothetical protein